MRRGHWSPPVLCEVSHELSIRCALHRVQTVPGVIHSAFFPLHVNLKPGLKTHTIYLPTPYIGCPRRILLPDAEWEDRTRKMW